MYTWIASIKLMNVGGEISKGQERSLVLKMLYAAQTSEFLAEISSNLNTSGLHSPASSYINCIICIMEPPIKDTLNKGHLSIRTKLLVLIPITPVRFNLQITDTSLINYCPNTSLFGGSTVHT